VANFFLGADDFFGRDEDEDEAAAGTGWLVDEASPSR